MKFILLVIFAFQFANFGQTQVTKTPPIPLNCDCLREWFEDRAEFFGTERPKKLARKIFNSWNTGDNGGIVDDNCVDGNEYKYHMGSNYCGAWGTPQNGYFIIANFLSDFESTNDNCYTLCCLTKKELKKAIRKIKRNC